MKDITKSETYQKALAHIIGHATFREDVQRPIDYIIQKKGDVKFCIGMVNSYTYANAMVSWVRDKDLTKFKEWGYLSAKLRRMQFQFSPYSWYPAYEFFFPLLCDNSEILDWYRQHRISYDKRAGDIKDRDNPKWPAFHGYQMILALNHEWDRLGERCEQILSMEIKKDRKYLIDHRFYLALAKGDKAEMENVLTELTSPKIARVRNYEFAFAFTEHFIATHATMYAKLAWLNGYEVEIDTPWIPKEWLPVKPLAEYPEPWDFLKSFDIWTPFNDEEDIIWSPKKR